MPSSYYVFIVPIEERNGNIPQEGVENWWLDETIWRRD